MADQIDHLVDMAQRDNVTLQIIPFEVGHYEAMRIGSISVMTHPWVQGRSVYWVRYPGMTEVTDLDEAAHFIAAVEQAATLALPPDQSLQFIAQAADQWRQTDARNNHQLA
jgi:hypothetical protein